MWVSAELRNQADCLPDMTQLKMPDKRTVKSIMTVLFDKT